MSSNGLIIRIAEEARITNEQALGALAAAFHGLLSLNCPSTSQGQPLEVYIVINPPPQPYFVKAPRPHHLSNHGELVKYIADTVGISLSAAGAALGVITQAIVEGGREAGLRAYYEYEPGSGK